MKATFSKPLGPFKTIRATYLERDIALIKKQVAGYQVIATTMMFKGKFGSTNTKWFDSLREAKNFVEDHVVELSMGK